MDRPMNYKTPMVLVILFASIILFSGCAVEPVTAPEFRFPIFRGSIENGKQSFVALGCNQCHTVNGVNLPAFQGVMPVNFELGGRIWYVKTYADLLTSIINPDHVISEEYRRKLPQLTQGGKSPMPFNGNMTVTQLIDLVTFLNSRYVLMEDYSPY